MDRIVLLNAEKVEKPYWSSHTLEEGFIRPLLIEGLQQCGDTQLPTLSLQRKFRNFVEDELPTLTKDTNKLLANEGNAPTFQSLQPLEHKTTWLAIGPEGGWNDFETKTLEKTGFNSFSMGERILRTDIACISALALILNAN